MGRNGFGNSPLDRMRLLNFFQKVLFSLASTTGEHLLETKNFSPTLIKITRYIEENYTSQLSLQTVFSHFNLSKRTLAASYKNITVIRGWDLIPHVTSFYEDKCLHPNDLGFSIYTVNLYKEILPHLIRKIGYSFH